MGDWDDFMTHTVTVAELDGTTRDIEGNLTAGTRTEVKCRLQNTKIAIRTTDGVLIDNRQVIITHTPIKPTHRIWLPGADTTDIKDSKKPSAIEEAPDPETDQTIYEVTL